MKNEYTIALPTKTLVVLCGPVGAGKSTFAAEHFNETQIVSSDFCRKLIFDSERNFRSHRDTFDLFHVIIEKRLKQGRFTVADSTALSDFARQELLERAQAAQYYTCLLLFNVSESTCIKRNEQRPRQVPLDVILSQHEQFPYTRQAVHKEAWNQIHELGEDVTGIRCVRDNRIMLAKTAE